MAREIRPDIDLEWPAPIPEPAEPRSHPDHIPDALGLGWDDLAALAELRDDDEADSEGGDPE
jgi:hypothetical protein